MFSQFLSSPLSTGGGGGWLSRKVHYEHILAGRVSGKVHSEHIIAGGCLRKCTLSTFLLQKCSCPRRGGGVVEGGVQESTLWAHSCYKSAHARGGWVSRKKHYSGNGPGNEHILGLPAQGMQSIFELPSCTAITLKTHFSSLKFHSRDVYFKSGIQCISSL